MSSSIGLIAQGGALMDTIYGIDYDLDSIPRGGVFHVDPPAGPPPTPTFDANHPYTPPKLIGGYWSILDSLDYPEAAKLAYLEGIVDVEVLIDHNGEIASTEVVAGEAVFNKSAMQAVNSTKWIPAKQRGKNVKVRVMIPVVYKLDSLFIPPSFYWDEGRN